MEKVEEKIREKLACKLDIFDNGLSLIKQESFLPNTKGTRGFVDLLARDSLNRYVLIELKRSKAASREAIHEILKYIEGIKENKSLKSDEIVAYIVSTEWDELLVPFSSFIKDVSYEVIGYKLEVDEELNPVAVECVKPLEISNERFVSDEHAICRYTTDENLTKGIESHLSSFSKKGIEDFVLLVLKPHPKFREYELKATMQGLMDVAQEFGSKPSMTYEELKEKMPEYKHMIYSAVQVMDNEKYWKIIKLDPTTYEEVKEYAEDWDETELRHGLHEYAVENCEPKPFQEHYEIGYPAKLGCKILEDEGWEVTEVIRGGRLKENDLLTDEIIIGELTGDGGTNNQKYRKNFDSCNKASFEQITKDVEKCLVNNEIWLSGLNKSINELSNLSESLEFEGSVNIYNPSNTLLSIHRAATSTDAVSAMRWIPSYNVIAEGEKIKRIYFGALIRNENSTSLDDVFKKAYDGDAFGFFLSLTWGGYQENDVDICPMYGLEYANFKCEIKGDERIFYKFDGFRYIKCEYVDSYIGVLEFLRENDDFVEDLIKLFEKNTLAPGVIQMNENKE